MITLLVVIYLSFIAVGLPDSLLGVAWPVIYPEFGLPISLNGYIAMTVSACTIVSSLFSARLNHKFGTGVVTAVSTAMTALALFGYACSGNVFLFFLLAIPLGLGAGAIDSGLNSFVALHYSKAQMDFLQCFYGLGVMISPYLMSLVLGTEGNWRRGYLIVAAIQTALTVLAVLALPLWKRMEKRVEAEAHTETKLLTVREVLRTGGVGISCLVFALACGIELCFGSWCSTYFVEAKGVPAAYAAQITVLFYIGLTGGRLLSGLLAKRLNAVQMLWISVFALLVAICVLVLPFGLGISAAALLMAGLGVGPLFPNLAHLTPKLFGREVASSVIGVQMSATYTGIMLTPMSFGLVAQYVSVNLFPGFLLVIHIVCMAALAVLLIRLNKKEHTL